MKIIHVIACFAPFAIYNYVYICVNILFQSSFFLRASYVYVLFIRATLFVKLSCFTYKSNFVEFIELFLLSFLTFQKAIFLKIFSSLTLVWTVFTPLTCLLVPPPAHSSPLSGSYKPQTSAE